MSLPFSIASRRVLLPGGRLAPATLAVEEGRIVSVEQTPGPASFDAGDLLLLPGMVDLHGDAFERQLMPRSGVQFPHDIALMDTDRQVTSNGITTAFHGLTMSWEPGLRSAEFAQEFAIQLRELRPRLAADTRLHLRFEIYGIDLESDVAAWIESGMLDLLAFNDHTGYITDRIAKAPGAIRRYTDRTSLTEAEFRDLLSNVKARKEEVPGLVDRLAALAAAKGIPMASHDDESPVAREWYLERGCHICEFPLDAETAKAAIAKRSPVVMGAPNVVRGGSHAGRLAAKSAVAEGQCTVLSSDYYYPAMLHAAFQLVADDVAPLPAAWNLVSRNPASAVGLRDRGEIAAGMRADFILVRDSPPFRPEVMLTVAAGNIAFSRLDSTQWTNLPSAASFSTLRGLSEK